MCDLLVDVAVETGAIENATQDTDYPVSCSAGRVIIAASAYQVWPSPETPAVTVLADGDLSDTATVRSVGNPGSITFKTINYFLTTGRVVTL